MGLSFCWQMISFEFFYNCLTIWTGFGIAGSLKLGLEQMLSCDRAVDNIELRIIWVRLELE